MHGKKSKAVPATKVSTSSADGFSGDHPVTNHESFSHSVLNAGANKWRAAVAPLLHGRSHGHPALKPHEHQNQDPHWHLSRGSDLRPRTMNKNV